ncbi:MAG: nitrous oxide-stimulated promoter family protein [Verrucomicrobiota bacterium]
MADTAKRLAREQETIVAMVRLYCRKHHGVSGGLCAECQALVDYAFARMDRCRYGAEKPTCNNCPTHCYQPARREQVRRVMRFAGPRMLYRHPLLAVLHLLADRNASADRNGSR